MKEILLDYGPAVLPWAAMIYKLPSLFRTPHDVGRRSLWLNLLFLALAATTLVPPVYVGIDHLLAHPNVARLLSNSLTLVTCWCVLVFLAHLSGTSTRGREIRWTGLLLGAALLIMAVLFLSAPAYPEALDYPERYATAPHVLEYRLVYLFYVATTLATMTRLSWRYGRVASHVSLRLGLRIVAVSGVAGLLYVVNDFSYLMTRRLSIVYPISDMGTVHQTLVVLLVGLSVIGATIPAWGPRLGVPRLYRWVTCYRALWRLYPLWLALCRSFPEIALFRPRSRIADLLNLRDVDFRLYRRVVEIRDGLLAMRPYVDPRIVSLATRLSREAGLDREEAEAVIEAASIVAGKSAKDHGEVNQNPEARHLPIGGADLDREVIALARVAWSYAHSPVVRAIRAHVQSEKPVKGDDQWTSPNRTRRWNHVAASLTRRSVAGVVSEVFSPLLVDAVLLVAIVLHRAPSPVQAIEWMLLAIGFVSVVPMLIIRFGVHRRRWSDRHVSVREQRPLPIALALLSIGIGLIVLIAIHASRELLAVLVAMLVGLTISLLITLVWKISLNTATLAGAIAILALAFSPALAFLFPLVALVGWARVELGSHNRLQVGVGAGIGVIVATAVFVLLR